MFGNNPKVLAFGEDLGFIGDVNQGFAGLQAKHGAGRIFDTGIRELTIMGQGIGLLDPEPGHSGPSGLLQGICQPETA